MNSTAQTKQNSQGSYSQKPPVQAGQQGTQKTDFRPEARSHGDEAGSSCSTNKVK